MKPATPTNTPQEGVQNENCCIETIETKLSSVSVLCRICYDNDKDEPLIAPCHCKGTVAFVHRTCLERWLAESNTTTCELCHVIFRTERTPKYTSHQSIWRWIRTSQTPGGMGRGVRGDLIACTIITPVAILVTYVCLFSSDYYNQKKFVTIPAAKWTSISLLIMIAIMLMGYYLWVYSVIRLHSRMWYNWWQRECVVRYIPPSSPQLCCRRDTEISIHTNTTGTPDLVSPRDTFVEINIPEEEDEEEEDGSGVAMRGILERIVNNDNLEQVQSDGVNNRENQSNNEEGSSPGGDVKETTI